MLSIPAVLALLPFVAWSTLAHPGPSKPTPSARLGGSESELFIGLGVGTTVIVNGVNKTCTSDEDIEVINVGSGPFNALPIKISYKEKYPEGTHTQTIVNEVSSTSEQGTIADFSAPSLVLRPKELCSRLMLGPATSEPQLMEARLAME